MRKIVSVFVLGLVLFGFNSASVFACDENDAERSRKESRYDHVYYNPPRQSLGAYGVYVYSNSAVRYVHSPSKLKREAHAARIDAYNMAYSYQ